MAHLPFVLSALGLLPGLGSLGEAAVDPVGIRSHVHAGYLLVEDATPESIRVDLLGLDGEFLKTLGSGEVAGGALRFRLPSEAVSGLALVRVRRVLEAEETDAPDR